MQRMFNQINKEIHYKDDYLNKDFLNNLLNKINTYDTWKKQTSVADSGNFFWTMDISDTDEFKNECAVLKNYVTDKVLRIYINGQSYTQHGDFHKDDGETTYLIGLNKNWNPTRGGATEFLGQESTSILIYPIYNRCIKFNAQIPHRALPNNFREDFRMTLAIKSINYKE